MDEYTLFYKCVRALVTGVKMVTVIHRYTLPATQLHEPYLTQSNVRAVRRLILARELRLYARYVEQYERHPEEMDVQYIGATLGHEPLERYDE